MIRTPLNQGDNLQLNSRQYTIEKVIGDGSTCIVYSAYYSDSMGHSHYVNIKECYPYNANIVRNGQMIIWNSSEEKAQCLDVFRDTYEKLMTWQNENSTVSVFDICKANNTLYIIMNADKGVTFDKDATASLHDILKTIKLLTHFVGVYHANGYLHLDLKPSNFLVYPRPSDHIVLFDIDTVTSIEDIRAGNVKGISYSDGWAAPEQKQGKISKLCPATDIFSIGAILFEKVMGRSVEAADMGVFADWDFEGEKFENVNPKIKRLLRNIFKKTLSANIKRRYQSTGELIGILEQTCNITIDGKPYLISNCPPITTHFIGRVSELHAINQAFGSNNRAVFLHGEGGIGKSSLAVAYGNHYQKDYDAVLFLRYRNSLENLFEDIDIQNYDSVDSSQKKILHRLMDEHILLIIDNFDVEVDQDEYLEELLRYKAHILFTTRTDFSNVYAGNIIQIEIDQLHGDELTQLFCRASGIRPEEKHLPYLNTLFKAVGFNTYAAELLGLQIAASGCSLELLSARIANGLDSLKSAEKVRAKKDGRVLKCTIPEIIRVVFQTTGLSESRQQVLRNMYLLRFLNIDRTIYAEFTWESTPGIDALNDLLELGWVRKNGPYFILHPLVEELVKNDLNPNKENCPGVFYSVSNRIRYCCDFDECGDDAAEEKYDQGCGFLCAFFENISLDDKSNRELLLEWLMGIIENENVEIGSPVHSCFANVYQRLAALITNKKTTVHETMKIRYIILEAWVREFGVIYCGDADYIQRMNQQRQEKLQESFCLAVEAAEALATDEREKVLNHLYELIFNAAWLFSVHEMPSDFVQQLYNERPQVCSLAAHDKKKLGLPLNSEETAEIEKFYEDYSVFAPDYTDAEIDEEQKCTQEFRNANDKVAFIERIIHDKSIPALKRAELVWYCTDMVFLPLHLEVPPTWFSKDTIDWALMEQILSVEEDFLISDEIHCESYDEHDNLEMYINSNTVNQVIVSAALGEVDDYEANMDILMDDIGRDVSWHLKHNEHRSHFVRLRDFNNAPLRYALNGLTQIGKSSWILPYLIRFATGWESYAKENNLSDKDPFFPIYRAIVECADNAYSEENVPPQYQLDYLDISVRYQGYIDEITGTTYTFRSKEE